MTDDPQTWVFSEGLAIYQDITPVSEIGARKALGRLGRDYGWKSLQKALRAVREAKPKQPYSYLVAILKAAPPETDMSAVPPQRVRLDGRELPTEGERAAMLEKFQALKANLRRVG